MIIVCNLLSSRRGNHSLLHEHQLTHDVSIESRCGTRCRDYPFRNYAVTMYQVSLLYDVVDAFSLVGDTTFLASILGVWRQTMKKQSAKQAPTAALDPFILFKERRVPPNFSLKLNDISIYRLDTVLAQ